MKLPASVLNIFRKTLLKARAPNLLLNAGIIGYRTIVAIWRSQQSSNLWIAELGEVWSELQKPAKPAERDD